MARSIKSDPTWKDPALLERAWALPVAKLYSPLLSQTVFSICGPTSVANVLRSMQLPAKQNPLRRFGLRAMSLEQIVTEPRELLPADWSTRAVHPSSVDELRTELRASNDERFRFIANFSRRPLFGGGGGHHSPLGGYLEQEDLAFILDVNAGFGPWLVSTERLLESMAIRGLARFERAS